MNQYEVTYLNCQGAQQVRIWRGASVEAMKAIVENKTSGLGGTFIEAELLNKRGLSYSPKRMVAA